MGAGYRHHCVVLLARGGTGSELKCWGSNAGGELGHGDHETRGDDADEMGLALPSVGVGMHRFALGVALGGDETQRHSCAILDDLSVKCWGSNSWGQAGLGTLEASSVERTGDRLRPVRLGVGAFALAIAAGASHSCALLDTRSVKCWGSNSFKQLGNGDDISVLRGYTDYEMGDLLPAVQLGVDANGTRLAAISVAAGGDTSCAVLTTGEVKCWGRDCGEAVTAISIGTGKKVSTTKKKRALWDADPPLPFASASRLAERARHAPPSSRVPSSPSLPQPSPPINPFSPGGLRGRGAALTVRAPRQRRGCLLGG